jgi:orotate phosphoribosyltransferase
METIGLILGILGLFGWPLIAWFFGSFLIRAFYSHFGSEGRVRREVENLVKERTIPFRAEEAGTYKSVRVKWFVDFLSAVSNPEERGVLDRWLTRWIWLKRLQPSRIAAPKLGNVVLASTVARRLGLPLVVVYQQLPGGLHTRDFDGEVRRGDSVLLVDDVASDSQFLMQVVDRLRRADARILGVVVLASRAEGDCASALGGASVPFYPVLKVDDAALAKLVAQVEPAPAQTVTPTTADETKG